MSEKQALFLLSAGFLCILPEPVNEKVSSLNFRKFYRTETSSQGHKLCAVLRYFETRIAELSYSGDQNEEDFKTKQKEHRE